MNFTLEELEIYIKILFVALVFFVIALLMRGVVKKFAKDLNKQTTYNRRITYTLVFVMFIIIITVLTDLSTEISTYVGLLSAGIAIALREVFINIFSWIFIEFRKPFEVGDRIEINHVKGDVVDIKVFHFTLIEVDDISFGGQSTGRLIDVPNHFVLSYPLRNYRRGFSYVWNEIRVLLTFESDWRLAKEELQKILDQEYQLSKKAIENDFKKTSKNKNIAYSYTSPYIYIDLNDSGVELSLRFMTLPKDFRTAKAKISVAILDLVKNEETISLAYPTKRVVD